MRLAQRSKTVMLLNQSRITQTAATVASLMGFLAPEGADEPNRLVLEKAESELDGQDVRKALLYNPDAIALWLYQKYTNLFACALKEAQMELPVQSVMPSVTPVCFASMYTGLAPEKHGIQSYVKPILSVDTLFDAAIRAGKKPAIVSTRGDSVSMIFLNRDMDYILCDTPDECNNKAIALLKRNQHDIITVYNANYDSQMHRSGPESTEALAQIVHNAQAYAELSRAANESWSGIPHMTAFLPDHGCHEIDGNLGSHGLDMPEDMHIIHMFGFKK